MTSTTQCKVGESLLVQPPVVLVITAFSLLAVPQVTFGITAKEES